MRHTDVPARRPQFRSRRARGQIDTGIPRPGLGDGEAFPGRRQINASTAGLDNRFTVNGVSGGCSQRFSIVHDRRVIGMGPVPLQHTEFRLMQVAGLTVPVGSGQLENPFRAVAQQPFHMELGRRGEIQGNTPVTGFGHVFGPECQQVRFHTRRRGQGGGFDLQKVPGCEETPDSGDNPGTVFQCVEIGRHVAVSGIRVSPRLIKQIHPAAATFTHLRRANPKQPVASRRPCFARTLFPGIYSVR